MSLGHIKPNRNIYVHIRALYIRPSLLRMFLDNPIANMI